MFKQIILEVGLLSLNKHNLIFPELLTVNDNTQILYTYLFQYVNVCICTNIYNTNTENNNYWHTNIYIYNSLSQTQDHSFKTKHCTVLDALSYKQTIHNNNKV